MRALWGIALCAALWGGAAQAGLVKIFYSSGTGFFIDRAGHVLTNAHVVERCRDITLSGAVSPRKARLLASDNTLDLALLQTDMSAQAQPAQFRNSLVPPAKGERVVLVGYPGKEGLADRLTTREAVITHSHGPTGEKQWLQLSDVVEQGNSGGPLFDDAGQVVGVITAKAVTYSFYRSAPQNGAYSHSGIAISLAAIVPFLNHHGVGFLAPDATNGFISAGHITDMARPSVVHIRCETGRQGQQ